MLGPVVEIKAIDLVNKGRGGSVLREYQRVILDLYVVESEGGWHIRLAHDRSPVHESARLDQRPIDKNGVLR